MDAFLICKRCHYGDTTHGFPRWQRRTVGKLPASCPHCHRRDWNKDNVVTRPKAKERWNPPEAVKSHAFGDMLIEPAKQPTVQLHAITCDCTECLLARGILG